LRRFLIHILGILLLAASIHAQDSIVQQKELWQGPLTLSPGFSSSQVISGICGAPLASPMEILALYSTIDSHATSIARSALEWDQNPA
jgi:hypothetical protein